MKNCMYAVMLFALPLMAQQNADQLIQFGIKAQQHISQDADKAFLQFQKNNQVSAELRNSLVGLLYNAFPIIIDMHDTGQILSTNTDMLHNALVGGVSQTGNGLMLYQWDSGRVLPTHQEMVNRVNNAADQTTTISSHATSVASVMISSGVQANALGIAPQAQITAYDFSGVYNELAQLAAANSNTLVTNHSYGYQAGWRNGSYGQGQGWYWFGVPEHNPNESVLYGNYSQLDSLYDAVARLAPNLLVVKSIGNDRNIGPTSAVNHWVLNDAGNWVASGDARPKNCAQTGYDCIPYSSMAKNILTVAAHERINTADGRYELPSDVVISGFSSFGPTDDGRIKPDLIAQGNQVNVATSAANDTYVVGNGTSVSTPVVSGIAALLQQIYTQQFPEQTYMRSDMAKALLINHAREVGENPGPDYQAGFGLVDAFASAMHVTHAAQEEAIIENGILTNGEVKTYVAERIGNEPIKATLVWIDPAAPAQGMVFNDRTPRLVNDLDLRIIEVGGTTHFPWTLDPENPNLAAVAGDNIVDNVEKVEIAAGDASAFNIQVSHKGNLAGNQNYALVVSGLKLSTQSIVQAPENDAARLKIFPNPARDKFFISLNTTQEGSYQLLSADGRVLQKDKLINGVNAVAISQLNTGVYYLLIQSGEKSYMRKLLVK